MRSLFNSLILLAITSSAAYALTFPVSQNTDIVGNVFTVTPQKMDTFSRYARLYDVGAYALMKANPGINEDYPDKQSKNITIPAQFILPSVRNGIVVNLAELRVYYFMPTSVATYPVSIGREGWSTPVRETSVVAKEKDPAWNVPDSILAEARAKGRPIPAVTPPGPNNPLGQYALHLGIPGYLLHGTNTPTSIGRRVSHGCMRLFPDDIKELFSMVPVGTPVHIIHEPVKAGWKDNQLYLQIYPLLHEHAMSESDRQSLVKSTINNAQAGRQVRIDWNLVENMMRTQTGIPKVISQ